MPIFHLHNYCGKLNMSTILGQFSHWEMGSNSSLFESGQASTETPFWGFQSQVIRRLAALSESTCHFEKPRASDEAVGWCSSLAQLPPWQSASVWQVNLLHAPVQSSLRWLQSWLQLPVTPWAISTKNHPAEPNLPTDCEDIIECSF